MLRANFSKSGTQYILIFSILILGSALGIYLGFNGSYLLIIGALLGVVFLYSTITKPWLAILFFFMLIPLENLHVFEGELSSTLTKLMGAYLVFILIISGSLKYINEVFKNKKVIFMLLFGIIATLSLPLSKNVSGSMTHLLTLWLSIALYFVLIMMIRNEKTLHLATCALITGGVLSVLSPLVLGYGKIEIEYGSTIERYGGLWGDQNEFAALLLVLIPLSLCVSFSSRKNTVRGIAGLSSVILFIGFLLTFSRSGFIALAVLALFSLFKLIRGRNRAKILAITVPVVIIAFIFIHNTIGDDLISRVESLRVLQNEQSIRTESSINQRYQYYFKIAPKIILEHPILGVGFRGFIYHNPYGQISHNTFLEVLTGTGIIGLIFFTMIIFLTWKELRKVEKYSKTHGNRLYLFYYSNALEFGFIACLVVGLFYSLDTNKMMWLLITLSSVLLNILRNENLYPQNRRYYAGQHGMYPPNLGEN